MHKLRCYFSFRSPFAAIALFRLRRLQAFADVDIQLMPVWPEVVFGGHIDNPTDNLFKMAYIFGDAARQAELAGLDRSSFDALAKVYTLPEGADYKSAKLGVEMGEENWALTHKAFLYAQAQGQGWAFADAIVIRRFNFDGQGFADVMNEDVISDIADSLGLDGQAALNAVNDPAIELEMSEIIKQGEADGVFGVPFFVLQTETGPERYWGNDRMEYILMKMNGETMLPALPACDLTKVLR